MCKEALIIITSYIYIIPEDIYIYINSFRFIANFKYCKFTSILVKTKQNICFHINLICLFDVDILSRLWDKLIQRKLIVNNTPKLKSMFYFIVSNN